MDYKTKITYKSWAGAKNRTKTNDPNVKIYYKDKGIDWFSGWDRFKDFLKDVGYRPNEKYSLDRIDGNKGYVPGNVRWACSRTQNLNKTRYKRKSSKYKGVSYKPKVNKSNPWFASISYNKKQIYLGYFASEKEAAKAYDKAALRLNKNLAIINIY